MLIFIFYTEIALKQWSNFLISYTDKRTIQILKRIKKIANLAVIAIATVTAHPAMAADHQFTVRSTIVTLDSGWAAYTYSVKLLDDSLTGVFANPAGCAFPAAGYVTSPTDTGRKLYQDQLLLAFLQNLPIRLLISGTDGDCPFDKPRIISVSLCRPSALGPC